MSNIQNKIGRGMFKIQKSIDKGKTKVDLLKETSHLNKLVEELSEKKLEIIINLGIISYKKIMEGKLEDEELKEISKSIVGFDYMIYENKKKIEEIILKSEGIACECGNRLNENIKFCNQCGKKIEKVQEDISLIKCNNCEMDIVDISKFCPCCGIILD